MKVTSAVRKAPNIICELLIVRIITLPKSGGPKMIPTIGMMILSTRAPISVTVARAITSATATSMRLGLNAKSLNSLSTDPLPLDV